MSKLCGVFSARLTGPARKALLDRTIQTLDLISWPQVSISTSLGLAKVCSIG